MNKQQKQTVLKYADGTRTITEIAKALHVAEATARRYVRIAGGKFLTEREAEYNKLVAQTVGEYVAEPDIYAVAKKLHVTPSTVHARLVAGGFDIAKPGKATSPDFPLILELRTGQHTIEEISAIVGKSGTHIQRILNGEGESVSVWLPARIIKQMSEDPLQMRKRLYYIITKEYEE